MKNILVAVDLETTDHYLLDYSVLLADKFSARVWIMHIAGPEPDYIGYEVGPKYIRDTRAHELRDEHKSLQDYATSLKSRGIDAESLLVVGPTVEMILEEAAKLSIDLIVAGSHSHSFLYRVFREVTSVEIVKKSKIPMLFIPLD